MPNIFCKIKKYGKNPVQMCRDFGFFTDIIRFARYSKNPL